MIPTRRQTAMSLLALGAAGVPLVSASAETAQTPAEDPLSIAAGESRNEHMMAPVMINGQGPFNFVLDTGANTSCVSHTLAQDLMLAPGPMTRVHTVVGVRERPSVVIDDLQIGKRNRKKVHAPSLPLRGPDVQGVLGVDWLRGQRLVLDFKKNEIEITRSKPDESVPGRTVVVPARRRMGQLTIVDAEMQGKPISAIIDSGAQGTLCNSALRNMIKASERRQGIEKEPRYVRLESLVGEQFRGEALFLPFLRLGGLHLGNVQVTCADIHVFKIWELESKPALVIGMDLLTQFESVALDFGRSAVRFEFV
jgi:hypothetical protein